MPDCPAGRAGVEIAYLARHPRFVTALARAFMNEWPAYYAGREIDQVAFDFRAAMNDSGLPIAFVAFAGPNLLGTVALRRVSIPSHAHLTPWLTGLYVAPDSRGRGIGGLLVDRCVREARDYGFDSLYAAVRRPSSLFRGDAWKLVENADSAGDSLLILRRDL
jgi:GNAT superfamily N-acetyltransferase